MRNFSGFCFLCYHLLRNLNSTKEGQMFVERCTFLLQEYKTDRLYSSVMQLIDK